MKRSFFLSIFPTPKYLEMPAVGLDISDRSIKSVELKRLGDKLIVDKIIDYTLPLGLVESGNIKDSQKLTAEISNLARQYKIKQAMVSLPEEKAFIFKIKLPFMKRSEIREAVELLLEEHVPLSAPDVVFDYEIIKEPGSKGEPYEISVSVLPKGVVCDYLQCFRSSLIKPLAFEVEAHALARSLIPRDNKGTVLLVDIGKTRTSFAIIDGSFLVFTSTVGDINGDAITKSIEKNLNINYAQAEKLKIEKGLLRSKDNEVVFYSLIPIVASLKDEIARIKSYWRTRRLGQGNFKKIILCGGQSTLPGLTEYLTGSLGITVEVGNPWVNIMNFNDSIPPINLNQSLRYATALGLALRSGGIREL